MSFESLANTRSVSSATLTLQYWDELMGVPAIALANALDATSETVALSTQGPAQPGSYVQIEGEALRVEERVGDGSIYAVTRGASGSIAATHAAGTPVYHLTALTAVTPFPPDFFGSPYSGSWNYPITLPDARIACAELFATNRRGDSPPRSACFTGVMERGLRTLSGGQYTIQIEGYLAVDQSATPPLVIESAHAVRDVYAVLGTAADCEVRVRVNVDGAPYCTLTFGSGHAVSDSAFGYELPPLAAGAALTLSVLAAGAAAPGADLTVLVRL